ncbi:hypothetical protein yruck0001_28410 [Yersinia ruckeri ATCC 29473]|nr:hypothetical protein yruck0001_28410 [Yersinia ruckeri ATCC 29473]CEK25745.1 hypothetical protein CSF007_p0325 [Yersinia ruckeri]
MPACKTSVKPDPSFMIDRILINTAMPYAGDNNVKDKRYW